MSYEFIGELSESKMFPTVASVFRHRVGEIAELTYLYLCAMRVLFQEDETRDWARQYARRTIQFGDFRMWRASSTDLYVLLHALEIAEAEEDIRFPLARTDVLRWMRDEAQSHETGRESRVKRMFARLDFGLKVRDSSMQAVRRLAANWSDLDRHEKELCITRLLQMFRTRAPKSELLPFLDRVARAENLEMKDVQNPEDELQENATAGATSAASVATATTAVGGIGVGFDPNGHKGIYEKNPKKKPLVLRR